MEWLNPPMVQQLGLTLLHFVWQGLVVGLLYAGSLFLLRPKQASTRYNLAVATLGVLALLPPLTFAWLARHPAVGGEALGGGAEFMTLMLESSTTTLGLTPLVWVVGLWLAGVLLLSVRLMLGWHYLLRLRRTADPLITQPLQAMKRRLQAQFGISRRVGLAASAQIESPVVIGWFKPLILFPPALVARLPVAQLEMVLAHELAHIRRHDHLVNLFQTVVETLLFYHPVVAWVSRQIRIERENACDDLAVEATHNRLAYVEMLASLEHLRRPGPRLALGMQDGQVLGRIRRLVEQARPAGQRGLTLPAVLLVSLLAGATGIHLMPEKAEIEPATSPVVQPLESAAVTETPSRVTPDPAESIQPEPEWLPPAPPAVELAEAQAEQQTESRPVQTTSMVAEPAAPVAEADREMQSAPSATADPTPSSPAAGLPAAAQAQEPEPVEVTPAQPDSQPSVLPQPFQMASLNRPESRSAPASQLSEVEATVELTPPPLTGGQLVYQVEPEFPARARQRRADGLVELEFLVDASGRVSDIEVLSELPAGLAFGEAATRAVAKWRFEPFSQGGKTIDKRVRLEVEFTPTEGCTDLLGSRIPRC